MGLFPSIGERLGLANDVEEKRPLSNPFARRRLEFLQRFGLINDVDIQTWRRNNTYELESLSTAFKNAKEEPVGLGIYLIEYMRLKGLPIKPPLPPDEELKELFDEEAREELRVEIEEEVTKQSPKEQLFQLVQNFLTEKIDDIIADIYNDFIDDLEECLKEVTAKEIKYHINQQYEEDPSRRTYDLKEIAKKLKTQFEVMVNWNADEIISVIKDSLTEYIDKLGERLWHADIEFTPIHNETKLKDIYDMALEKIGANPEDAKKVREALKWRFQTDARITEKD